MGQNDDTSYCPGNDIIAGNGITDISQCNKYCAQNTNAALFTVNNNMCYCKVAGAAKNKSRTPIGCYPVIRYDCAQKNTCRVGTFMYDCEGYDVGYFKKVNSVEQCMQNCSTVQGAVGVAISGKGECFCKSRIVPSRLHSDRACVYMEPKPTPQPVQSRPVPAVEPQPVSRQPTQEEIDTDKINRSGYSMQSLGKAPPYLHVSKSSWDSTINTGSADSCNRSCLLDSANAKSNSLAERLCAYTVFKNGSCYKAMLKKNPRDQEMSLANTPGEFVDGDMYMLRT